MELGSAVGGMTMLGVEVRLGVVVTYGLSELAEFLCKVLAVHAVRMKITINDMFRIQ